MAQASREASWESTSKHKFQYQKHSSLHRFQLRGESFEKLFALIGVMRFVSRDAENPHPLDLVREALSAPSHNFHTSPQLSFALQDHSAGDNLFISITNLWKFILIFAPCLPCNLQRRRCLPKRRKRFAVPDCDMKEKLLHISWMKPIGKNIKNVYRWEIGLLHKQRENLEWHNLHRRGALLALIAMNSFRLIGIAVGSLKLAIA